MRPVTSLILASVSTSLFSAAAMAAPAGVDGAIGAEWAGATVKSVLYNPAAPTGNFATPTNETNNVAYDVYTRTDGAYLYVGLQTTGYSNGLNFANLYLNTNLTGGSDLGFEVNNERAFIPGGSGYFPYTPAGQDIHYAMSAGASPNPSAIEFAVPLTFFTSDPLGMGFPVSTTGVQVRMSQSFGYSAAGGASYGADRLGQIAIPEPASGIALLAAAGLLISRQRKI